MIDVVPQSRAGRTVACSATLIVALGAAVFALWDTPDKESVDGTPVAASAVPTLEGLVEPARPAPVGELAPDVSVGDGIGVRPLLSDSDDSQWNDGDVKDTGPFIDADDDAADYSFSPVLEVGEFLDPDAG